MHSINFQRIVTPTTMQPLLQHLQQTGQFTEQQIEQLRSGIQCKTFQKGDYFSGNGQPVNEMAYVLKGILRVFSRNPEAQDITRYFIDEHHFVVAGDESIQAVMRTDLAVLSAAFLQDQGFTLSDWSKLRDIITATALVDKAEQISPNLAGDATARYRKFMEKYPQIAGRVPLSYLASYLGITQQSLSRIRKQLTRKSPPREND